MSGRIVQICKKYSLKSLEGLISSIEGLSRERYIDIAVFGQFKTGKSSFINSIIDEEILPTGVIPVTSIITRIYYAPKEKASIKFNDGREYTIGFDELASFISETKNPQNIKNVAIANIETPALNRYKKLRFVDTPGIGSIFLNNTQTTQEWSIEATVAIVCISAERPLSEFDLKLIKELDTYSYKMTCLLTKTDLFTTEQINEIKYFIKKSIKKEIHKDIEIYPYSIKNNLEEYKNNLCENLCNSFSNSHEKEIALILHHKKRTLATKCLKYIEIAYKSSLNSEKERASLKKKIFDENLNTKRIQKDFILIIQNNKLQIREKVYELLYKHTDALTVKIKNDFKREFKGGANGNLAKFTQKYRGWLISIMKKSFKDVMNKEKANIDAILAEISEYFAFYTNSFREKLGNKIYKVLAIELSPDNWEPEFRHLKEPDISIYRVFDTNLDLIWFMFPMFIFQNIFKQYFLNQIEPEIKKNIHRITSGITESINNEMDKNRYFALNYIKNELETVEGLISSKCFFSQNYLSDIKKLKNILKETPENK